MIVVDYFRHKNHFASCYSAVALLKASVSMAGTMEAALLVVVDNIGWEAVVHIHKKLQETSLQACAAVRRLPREKLVVRARHHPPLLPIVAVGEAHPEHDGPAHGTRVPRIRVRSVEWDILSTAVLTCYCMLLLRCRRRGHGVWRQVRRQSAGGGVA